MFKQNVLSETSCFKGQCHLKWNSKTTHFVASGYWFLPGAPKEEVGGSPALGLPGKEQFPNGPATVVQVHMQEKAHEHAGQATSSVLPTTHQNAEEM